MKTQDAEKKQKIKGLDRSLAVSRLFYLRYSQICATASHKLREKKQILSTVSRKLGSIAEFGGKSVLPKSPMASDLFIPTPKKLVAVNGAVKTPSGTVNGTVNGTVKTPSGTLNGTLNGTLKGGQIGSQIGGQIGGQIELTVSRLFYPKYSQIRETTSRILGEKQQYAKIDNAGICDSVNQKFETPPDIMKIRTRSYPHNNFRSLSKNNEKKFGSNQMKEMGL
ncbi:MAG: hypothetical protein IJG38_08000 [Thermoguttaceae bacterium]|nr:hypothetical protein [Thermoguttaceae bacterium]